LTHNLSLYGPTGPYNMTGCDCSDRSASLVGIIAGWGWVAK
jgi:hypothetical protein